MHRLRSSGAALVVLAAAASAHAQVTYELISESFFGYAGFDVSADGSVIVGNVAGDLTYETFRWTAETGAVRLGRSTASLGTGAGTPNVSHDGTRISATIISADGMYQVAGVWENGLWTEARPLPPDGGPVGSSESSAWGISGDGQSVVGLYFRPGQSVGSAQPLSWNDTTGGERLGPTTAGINNARANAASYDGSVVAGWRATTFGTWQPTVWENGAETILEPGLDINDWCMAYGVSPDGKVVMGQTWNNAFQRKEATIWRKGQAGWVKTVLGSLPGTGASSVWANDSNADGSVVVGTNQFFDAGPNSPSTGFIWTEATGMVDVVTFLSDNGITVDPFFDIITLEAITPDGRTMIGLGRWTDTLDLQTFRITIAGPEPCPGDGNGDGVVDFNDITAVLENWQAVTIPYTNGDANGDGVVDFNDTVEVLANWGNVCPAP